MEGEFEESVSFGEARREGAWLCINNYKIPSMTLLPIASQDYILIPYQKDGKWGLADINGKIVIYQNTMRLGYKGYLIPQTPVKPEFFIF